MKFDKSQLLIYAVTDRAWTGKMSLYEQTEAALKGGATMVQLREKGLRDDNVEEYLEEAKKMRALTEKYNVPLLIDDNIKLANFCGADGVHVGQSDMEALDVRAKLGPDKIIGVSAQTVEQALLAQKHGADYLGVGAVFTTGSKADADDVSHETLKAICEAVDIPVIAIGGIGIHNVMELAGSGICGVAVISAIFAQPDIQEATKRLKEETQKMVKA